MFIVPLSLNQQINFFNTNLFRKRCLLLVTLLTLQFVNHAATIFTESMGTVGGTTSLAAHESANGFDNDTYTMTQGGLLIRLT